jgi:two-component system, chemotaxis family, sensor kinase CheA
MNKEELAARLLATFGSELEEQVRQMNDDLLALETDPTNPERLKSLFRVAHTLKGASRASGVSVIEQACHQLESMLVAPRDGRQQLSPADFSLLYDAADALLDAGHRLRGGASLDDSPLAQLRDRLKFGGGVPGGFTPLPPMQPAAPPPAPPPLAPAEAAAPRPERKSEAGQVRIEATKLDALLAASGQLLIAGGRVSSRRDELATLHERTGQWASDWQRYERRMRVELERAGASPLLLSAMGDLREGLKHLVLVSGQLATQATEDSRTLAQATDEVGDRVRRLRLRPFAEACEALPRVVRDIGAASGKDVDLELKGTDIEADRAVLDGLRQALGQLVRNAIDHGIESPEQREKTRKPPRARITVAASLQGDRLQVTVSDDGRGMDVEGIRAALARSGAPVPAQDRDVVRTLFLGGLSTRNEASIISGRGVGLDIVRAAITRMQGTVDVTWTPGQGTQFTIDCPPSLATIRTVLTRLGTRFLAFPTAQVERMARLDPAEIRQAEGRNVMETDGSPVPLIPLGQLIPPADEYVRGERIPVILLRAEGQRLAVAVDELISEQEVVLRPLGPTPQPLPLVSGAAILPSGTVALVLNVPALLAVGLKPHAGAGTFTVPRTAARARPRILVADDSITTRTLEQSILESAGYEVRTAVDGADAWRLLQEHTVDLVVSDVEMPRMDGFGLCQAIRGAKRLKHLPVILVTALESSADRTRGLEAGADAYLGKSSFDQQHLLDTIQQLIGAPEA